jgi:hypothetical protein
MSRPAQLQPGVAARVVATALYGAVLDQRQPLDQLIDPATGDEAFRALPPRDRRLVHAIIATALRRNGEIGAALDRLIERPLPRRTGDLRRILEIAAAQLLFMEVADHAVVSVALEQLGADSNARHFKGLGNAVLRRLAREKDTIRAGLDAARLDTPDWLWQRWANTYGETIARQIATEAGVAGDSSDEGAGQRGPHPGGGVGLRPGVDHEHRQRRVVLRPERAQRGLEERAGVPRDDDADDRRGDLLRGGRGVCRRHRAGGYLWPSALPGKGRQVRRGLVTAVTSACNC